jgi:hypothetical protein
VEILLAQGNRYSYGRINRLSGRFSPLDRLKSALFPRFLIRIAPLPGSESLTKLKKISLNRHCLEQPVPGRRSMDGTNLISGFESINHRPLEAP